MLTRILALVAVLLLAPSTLAPAHAHALSLESASLGIFARNVDILKEIPDLSHYCIKEKSTEQSESSNRREEYLRARYMDPGQGRFLGMDPWEGMLSEPRSLHRYQYANANPLFWTDPSGAASLIEITTRQNLEYIAKAYNYASFAVDLYSGGLTGAARAVAEEVVFGKLSKFRPIARLTDDVIQIFGKIWSKGVQLRLGRGYNSRDLRHNMEQVLGPLPPNHIPHHLVPSTSPAMAKLQHYGTDPNSPSNGVALPSNASVGSVSATHAGRHCSQYYAFVERLVVGANDKEEVINALALIRLELLSGSIVVQGCT